MLALRARIEGGWALISRPGLSGFLFRHRKNIWSAPECKEKSSEGKDEVLHTYIRPLDEALASGPDGICVFQT
uniref:Uncharacterized protein n=1 Tax=Candidatus Kentrum sp. LPFa TaxID=2126335 RepID=A0A450Y3U7_9GAMM|nr:MAG: hypothetical protein BECKLPF1236A_GA0070988_104532 [Candidatus Kentron sp. LPFa]VFK36223.1 MAG: hypothetical protein BECKLPF1236C_GA0070990_105331 [Candidatus Kentron sp. LPFa]